MERKETKHENIFENIAKAVLRHTTKKKKWNTMVRKNSKINDPIGSTKEAEMNQRKRQSLRKHILANISEPSQLDDDKLLGNTYLRNKT